MIKSLLKGHREDFVGGPCIVFTQKAFVHETFTRKPTKLWKSFVSFDGSQKYPYSIYQPMVSGLFSSLDLDSKTGRFTPRRSKTRIFENMVMSYFQRAGTECKIKSSCTTGR